MPVNLGAFHCPKLLICGDTHHMQRPISSMIGYARAEAFDAVASVYDRHHLHWFLAAGLTECAWLPGISVQDVAPPWQTERRDQVAFVGQMGAMHVWRQALLEQVAAAGIPLRAGLATRAQAAALYAQSLASFNGSLNGDLNMRVFEVLSAGGFLLTDRLSPQAGLELLLRPGKDCETYGDAGEQAAAEQLELRITIYEMLQELQQLQSGLSVVVSPGWPLASALDLTDLMRVRVTVIEPAPALRAAAAAASVLDQLAFIGADAATRQNWDIVLTASPDGARDGCCLPISGTEPAVSDQGHQSR